MKHITTIVVLLFFSHMGYTQDQNDPYTLLWNKVHLQEQKGLTKSALQTVDTISHAARKDHNTPQLIKSLLFRSKYLLILEEDAQLKIVNQFKEEIEQSTFPTTNVLESYLGNMYWQYFQQNRYRFYNRSTTETKVDSLDFRTWDLRTLFTEIGIHFKNSLERPSDLRKIAIRDYELILDTEDNSTLYRPSLLDLLAHTALGFYRTNENTIDKPSYTFQLTDPEYLCEAAQFQQLKITSKDSASLQVRALQLYQLLLQQHQEDPSPEGQVYLDIERLKFIHQHAIFDTKDEQYVEVLKNSASRYSTHEISGEYHYEVAAFYHQQGNTYQAKTNETHQWKHKEALALCDNIINKHPESTGTLKSKALKETILNKNLILASESHIPVNRPAKLLIDYKNHNALEFTAYHISNEQIRVLNDLYREDKKLDFIQKLRPYKTWGAELKNEGDYQNHRIEVPVPSMEVGSYLIFAAPKKKGGTYSFAFNPLQVTDILLVEHRNNGANDFQVIDRNDGKPLANARLSINYQVNYNGQRYTKTFTSDKNGLVPISPQQRWSDVNVVVRHEKDRAFFNGYYFYKRGERRKPGTQYTSFLFTDRSIYRPGQPLYFKGIAIEKNEESSKVLENTEVTVTLRDVNGQEVRKATFKTNDFGSFQGEFIIPNGGLTGSFSLQVRANSVNLSGYANIAVEEYKRPKFETSFDPITQTFKVNDSVVVQGKAQAYAGNMITDAQVSYTVRRSVYYPRWYWHYSSSYYRGSDVIIAKGETLTDAQGSYTIPFEALPDLTAKKENHPTFTYEVTADVTDINGETHSATTYVNVGYHLINANINVATLLDKTKGNDSLVVSTTNLNGQFVATKGSIKVYKLEGPGRVLRNRPWPAPDYHYFTEEEFKEQYPYEAFQDENDAKNWKKGPLRYEQAFDTGIRNTVALGDLKKWVSGKYIIELEAKDRLDQIVRDVAQTTLFSPTDKRPSDHQLFHIKTDKNGYDIGDKVTLTLMSAAKNLKVTVYIEKDHKIVDTHIIHLKNNSKSLSIPVKEADLGGFGIQYSYAIHNSFYSGSLNIEVPYPDTQLRFETITFRDKLKPGTEEQWTFKVKGPQGDQVTAEILASMYDASLDAFQGHYWGFNPLYRGNYYTNSNSNARNSLRVSNFRSYNHNPNRYPYPSQGYDALDWFEFYFGQGYRLYRNKSRRLEGFSAGVEIDNETALEEIVVESEDGFAFAVASSPQEGAPAPTQAPEHQENKEEKAKNEVQIRKNLQETAFFFPQLHTDKEGNFSFSFTSPEALTQWKLQLLAHTKTLQSATLSLNTVTQKELMVVPNAPRFLREGDQIRFSSKIANLTESELKGKASLVLIDPISGKPIDNALGNTSPEKDFTVDAKGNTVISWSLSIPENIQAVQYTVIAKAGDYSDAEQNVLPVLQNRMLVTETLPMWVRSDQRKSFRLEKLRDNTSTSLKHHKLTLEITSNPAWYAVQALPYLMEYPYECNEQTFSRFYANSLASHIANSNPRIQQVFEQWANTDALLSNLEKNQELKSLLIQETPWLRDAQSETEQKKRIALLFNMNKMKDEQKRSLSKLKGNQSSSGAWPWFQGGRDNRFITQHIIAGIGHLQQLKVHLPEHKQMISKAIAYLDREFIKEYEVMKRNTSNINADHLSYTQIHYLYTRSFFNDIPLSKEASRIRSYYKGQAKKYWNNKNLYSKGLLSLILHRMDDTPAANQILRSLKENSIVSEELGMYWKANTASWYWHQAPIETQAIMIEAFSEIQQDIATIDNLKIWLLKNKQTNQWSTTKATTDAIYALLLQGSEWLSVSEAVDVLVGGKSISNEKLAQVKVEAGTGYYKTSWNAHEIQPEMAEITLDKKGKGIAWGALYWQYFEDLDKITSAKTPLQLKKKLFLKKNTNTGEEIREITKKTRLKIGDLVRVRIELRADRAMEFVHMKDMRASGLEPINVFSRYKWQDGLGYYESTKDASTNFFFDYLPKGVYVFEYDLRVNNAGDFSNGITTIQSMYAPEFSSHSEGVRVMIED
ncbi:alpha-2-macroglobulin family protein [Spongiimicrobium salis]|uniref:alpha-2-macroglobulin family protein n=1 Tax=Spongiimicrobium salis TaxID=1667022 RepID=UPI00374CC2EF